MQTFLAGVAGALTVTVLMGATAGLGLRDDGIVFPDGSVQTTAAAADPRRAFYLTNTPSDGSQALGACAPGFHMASLWEIHDVSTLRYATDEEGGTDVRRTGDSGFGPPAAGDFGWVRTGHIENTAATEGLGNCSAWSTTDGSGTIAGLGSPWGNPSAVLAPWDSVVLLCSLPALVWCVEDYPGAGS
jgi:hypothetical protein